MKIKQMIQEKKGQDEKKETREAETRHYRYHEKDTPDYIREE